MSAPAPARPAPHRTGGWGRPESPVRRIGPLPLAAVVALEIGLAGALLLLAADTALLPVAVVVALGGLVVAFGRRNHRWLTDWLPTAAGFATRGRTRALPAAEPGAGDRRSGVLRLAVPDLVIAPATSHDGVPLALLHDRDEWATVLAVRPGPSLLSTGNPDAGLPLPVLAGCLEDRGVLLRRIRVVWHSFPGATALPAGAPAARAYREVLGPLSTVARRTTWITIGLSPEQSAAAVAERGGGDIGARRALVGVTSRVRRALADHGVATGALDENGVLRAGVVALDLASATGSGSDLTWQEQWSHVSIGGIGHRVYAITGLPTHLDPHGLETLTAIHAQSVTVALSLAPERSLRSENRHDGSGMVRMSGLVRVSARAVAELDVADQQVRAAAAQLGMRLEDLCGHHGAGLAATLPLVGRP